MPSGPSKQRRALRNIVLVGFGVLAVLVTFAEIYLRSNFDERLRMGGYPQIYQEDEALGYRYVPSTSSMVCIPGICKLARTNPGGLVGTHFKREKRDGVFRIALVGDCDSTGIWMDSGQPFGEHLEHMLRADGMSVEVYNFSQDGEWQDVERLRRAILDVPSYQPDFVLLQIDQFPLVMTNEHRAIYRNYVVSWGADIPGARRAAESRVDRIESHGILISLYQLSFIVRAIAHRYKNVSKSEFAEDIVAFKAKRLVGEVRPTPLSTRESRRLLSEARAKLEALGADLVVFGMPHGKASRVESGMESVEVVIPNGPEFHPKGNNHLNDRAQRDVAKQLYQMLKPRISARVAATPKRVPL